MLKKVGFSKVYIACGFTDLRKGIPGLIGIIRLKHNLNPLADNTLYLFCGHSRKVMKGLTWDGDGYCLIVKRLSTGAFQWPRTPEEMKLLSHDEFYRLLDGFSVVSSIPKPPTA